YPPLTGRIGRVKETFIPKKLVLPIKADLQAQCQSLLVFSESGKHLLAGAKRRMPPGHHLARLRQSETERANLLQSAFISFGFHMSSLERRIEFSAGSRSVASETVEPQCWRPRPWPLVPEAD